MAGHKIFLSYSRRDDGSTQAMIERLTDFLSSREVQCFRDLDAIAPGDDWQASIARKINECSVVLCIVSPAYLQSHWCRNEWAIALSRGRPVIPILVKDAQLEPPLSMLHSLDLRGQKASDPELFQVQCERLELAISTLAARNATSAETGRADAVDASAPK